MNADLSANGKKIILRFEFDREMLELVRSVPGRKFVPKEKGGPFWEVPADMETARHLRRLFGAALKLSPALSSWGRVAKAQETNLQGLANAQDATLDRLPAVLPELYGALTTRPWQLSGTKFLAVSSAPLNADEPRMGKTLMEIAAVYEADLEVGAHLVIAPKSSLDSVWRYEIERWTGAPVYVAGEGSRKQREDEIAKFVADPAPTKWLVIQPSMVRMKNTDAGQVPEYPDLHAIHFATGRIDESHKAGIINTKSLTSIGLRKLNIAKRSVMSGTPFGGKPINLWSILNFLHPERFSSKWRWADQWLIVEEEHVGRGKKVKKIGSLRPERKDDFYAHLAPYMLRRKREEVRVDLLVDPPVDRWVTLAGRAAMQYKQFSLDAEVKIEGQTLTATSILAEYTRLKQFSWGYHSMLDGKLMPSVDSPKMEAIIDLLDERGVFDYDADEIEEPEQVVIFSQFRPIVDVIAQELSRRGVKVGKITGEVTQKGARAQIQNEFQSGNIQVMVMTTTAGGVAITLNRAKTVIIVDETWVPDDQIQAVDRIENLARNYRIGVYYLRSRNTIEETIMNANLDKADINRAILDERRRGRLS